ncbi:unnamed protein product, partial [Laminaria digitata]
METEATAAAEKAEAWKRAAAASADVAATKEQAQREAAELARREESMDQVDRQQRERLAKMLIIRIGRDRDRALLFRGWSRLCLHAASLSAAEGASAAATAAARAARAEAMETEATAAAKKAEECRVSTDMVASTEQAQKGANGASTSVGELDGREEVMGQLLREHREHRAKMLMFRVSGDRRKARLFRGWNRLRLHAVSLSATEGALPITTATTRAVGAEAMEWEATSATDAAVEDMDENLTRRRTRAAMMVQRFTANRNKQSLWRAWTLLCQHTAARNAAAAAASAALTTAASVSNTGGGDPL